MKLAVPIAALTLALAAPARAWPVNERIELKVGEEKFQRLTKDAWVEVESPAIVDAELLETAEVMLTGKAEGSSLVLVHAEGRVLVWRVVVFKAGLPPARPAPDAAAGLKKDCKDAKVEGAQLTATVSDDRCRKALLALFSAEQGGFLAKDLDLTFEMSALQSQLKDVEQGLHRSGAQVRASYLGAGLHLEGKATAAQHRKVYWEVFRASLGRLALEDRIETVEGEKSP